MKEQMKKIALLSLSLILTSAYSVSIVLPSLLQHFSEYTTAQVEILISAPSFAITVMIVLNAWLSRYMKDRPMIVGGLLLLSVSGMVPVFVQEYPVVLASRIFLGIGIGLINAKAISIFSEYYEGREKAMDYINLLHASGMYEKQTAKIIPFRSIDIFENAVSAGTGNFLVDGPKETVRIDESILPEDTTFGVRISGDSMEPEFHDGQIAWVLQQESVANGEIGIFALNGEAYIKKLQNDKDGIFLISLNEKYAPIKVGENDRLDIFGKVLGKSDASAITGHC